MRLCPRYPLDPSVTRAVRYTSTSPDTHDALERSNSLACGFEDIIKLLSAGHGFINEDLRQAIDLSSAPQILPTYELLSDHGTLDEGRSDLYSGILALGNYCEELRDAESFGDVHLCLG